MKIKSISGQLFFVDDLDVAAKFYEKLGFRLGKRTGDSVTVYVNWYWMEFRLGDAEHRPYFHKLKVHPTQCSYVAVENVNETYEFLKSKKIKVLAEPQTYDSGRREVMIADPDGYTIVFFEKI